MGSANTASDSPAGRHEQPVAGRPPTGAKPWIRRTPSSPSTSAVPWRRRSTVSTSGRSVRRWPTSARDRRHARDERPAVVEQQERRVARGVGRRPSHRPAARTSIAANSTLGRSPGRARIGCARDQHAHAPRAGSRAEVAEHEAAARSARRGTSRCARHVDRVHRPGEARAWWCRSRPAPSGPATPTELYRVRRARDERQQALAVPAAAAAPRGRPRQRSRKPAVAPITRAHVGRDERAVSSTSA